MPTLKNITSAIWWSSSLGSSPIKVGKNVYIKVNQLEYIPKHLISKVKIYTN